MTDMSLSILFGIAVFLVIGIAFYRYMIIVIDEKIEKANREILDKQDTFHITDMELLYCLLLSEKDLKAFKADRDLKNSMGFSRNQENIYKYAKRMYDENTKTALEKESDFRRMAYYARLTGIERKQYERFEGFLKGAGSPSPEEAAAFDKPEDPKPESQCPPSNPQERKYNHYYKDVSNYSDVDFYRIALLYDIRHPGIQHAVKKLMAPGKRGAKDFFNDVKESRDTLNRVLEMAKEDGHFHE